MNQVFKYRNAFSQDEKTAFVNFYPTQIPNIKVYDINPTNNKIDILNKSIDISKINFELTLAEVNTAFNLIDPYNIFNILLLNTSQPMTDYFGWLIKTTLFTYNSNVTYFGPPEQMNQNVQNYVSINTKGDIRNRTDIQNFLINKDKYQFIFAYLNNSSYYYSAIYLSIFSLFETGHLVLCFNEVDSNVYHIIQFLRPIFKEVYLYSTFIDNNGLVFLICKTYNPKLNLRMEDFFSKKTLYQFVDDMIIFYVDKYLKYVTEDKLLSKINYDNSIINKLLLNKVLEYVDIYEVDCDPIKEYYAKINIYDIYEREDYDINGLLMSSEYPMKKNVKMRDKKKEKIISNYNIDMIRNNGTISFNLKFENISDVGLSIDEDYIFNILYDDERFQFRNISRDNAMNLLKNNKNFLKRGYCITKRYSNVMKNDISQTNVVMNTSIFNRNIHMKYFSLFPDIDINSIGIFTHISKDNNIYKKYKTFNLYVNDNIELLLFLNKILEVLNKYDDISFNLSLPYDTIPILLEEKFDDMVIQGGYIVYLFDNKTNSLRFKLDNDKLNINDDMRKINSLLYDIIYRFSDITFTTMGSTYFNKLKNVVVK